MDQETIELMFFFGCIAPWAFVVPLWGPQLVFQGLVPPAPPSQPSGFIPSFSLADFCVLLFYFAIVNAIVRGVRTSVPAYGMITWLFAVNSVATFVWVFGLRFQRRYGISESRSRILFLGILFPLAVLFVGELTMSLVLIFEEFRYIRFKREPWPLVVARFERFHQPVFTIPAASLFILFALRQLFARFIRLEPVSLAQSPQS